MYVQKLDRPKTIKPYIGDKIKEYGQRMDELVQEKYLYLNRKLDETQVF